MFLDDSACNLASLNLMKFLDADGDFDVEGFKHAVGVFITAQEILVDASSYPTEEIAKNSHDYRPLGLGYANLGTLLMVKGIPYDSPKAVAWCGAITSLMTGQAYAVSAQIAQRKGPFPGYAKNRDSMLDVIKMHRDASLERRGRSTCPRTSRSPAARSGTTPSSSAASTGSATPRPRCSPPRAPSASSWTATPRASSPTSPSSSSRSSPAAATSRS